MLKEEKKKKSRDHSQNLHGWINLEFECKLFCDLLYL